MEQPYSPHPSDSAECVILLLVFIMNQFPPSPWVYIWAASNFFENLRRYSQINVDHQYQRHRQQILPTVSLVLLIPVTNLPPVLFGTDSDQNRITWGNPQKWCSDSLPLLLGHLGLRAPYATRRKLRYEANQVWMNTTFISQGPQSWGKLAVETWRVKTELIIITILHIIIITTSILNPGFKTIAPKILAHTKCINRYWKYTQIFAAIKSSKTDCKTGKTYCKK